MRAEFINPFVSATQNVFQTMLATKLTRGALSLKQNSSPLHEVCGLIGLAGKYHGMVVLSFGRETALLLAGKMLGNDVAELNPDVVDAVGELTNMVAGSAKSQLEQCQMSIGLPTVICGKTHSISFPSGAPALLIPFESDMGPICVEVGISESRG
jgi:chemotaxis protein CheX